MYHFFDKVFFLESDVTITNDFILEGNPETSIYGYVDVENVNSNPEKIGTCKPKKVINLKDRRDFNSSLTKDEKEILTMYYRVRVMTMERKQGTTDLESVLLDQVEYMRMRIGKKFNARNYIKGLSHKHQFSSDKLYSGFCKRMACRKWAKRDFLKNDRKFNNSFLPDI